jgi:hypothetical protein
MTVRATSLLLVQALIRRTHAEGGFAAVLHKGDAVAGAILVQIVGAGQQIQLFERTPDFSKGYQLSPAATSSWGNEQEITQYLDRRLRSDPDMWIIELDVANAEQLAAAILTED